MTYAGHVENGIVVLDEGALLPDGARVEVSVVEASGAWKPQDASSASHSGLEEFIGIVDDMPEDLARNHDHYLYGAPKK